VKSLTDQPEINKFSEEVRTNEYNVHNGYCRVKGCTNKIHSFHHRIENTKYNRKKFPLFIQSQMNCAGLCDQHHINHSSVACLDINEQEAMHYEKYLEDLISKKTRRRE